MFSYFSYYKYALRWWKVWTKPRSGLDEFIFAFVIFAISPSWMETKKIILRFIYINYNITNNRYVHKWCKYKMWIHEKYKSFAVSMCVTCMNKNSIPLSLKLSFQFSIWALFQCVLFTFGSAFIFILFILTTTILHSLLYSVRFFS